MVGVQSSAFFLAPSPSRVEARGGAPHTVLDVTPGDTQYEEGEEVVDIDPVSSVILAWLLFAGTHIGMTSAPVRGPLASRLGENGFVGLFSLVAAVTFSILVYVYAGVSTSGPAGLALGASPWLYWPLFGLSIFGVVCMFGSLFDYPASAYSRSSAGHKAEPTRFERITRHGFAVGLGLVAVAHALFATRLVGTIFFGALAIFAFVGSAHQDAKLLARNPDEHRRYLDQTSMLPFVAILTGRNKLALSEIRPLAIALGLLAAWGLRLAHPSIFASGGIYVIAIVLAGAAMATFQDMRRAKRRGTLARGRGYGPSATG